MSTKPMAPIPPPPRPHYRLPAVLVLPVMLVVLLVEIVPAFFLLFGFVGALQLQAQLQEIEVVIDEATETAEGVMDMATAGAVALGVACALTGTGTLIAPICAAVGGVGGVLLWIGRKIVFSLGKYVVKKSVRWLAEGPVREVAASTLAFFKAFVAMMVLFAHTVAWTLLLIVLHLRGVPPREVVLKGPGLTSALIATKLTPIVQALVPSLTVWLWVVWRRTRREDRRRYEQERAAWEAAYAQAMAHSHAQLRLALRAHAAAVRAATAPSTPPLAPSA